MHTYMRVHVVIHPEKKMRKEKKRKEKKQEFEGEKAIYCVLKGEWSERISLSDSQQGYLRLLIRYFFFKKRELYLNMP